MKLLIAALFTIGCTRDRGAEVNAAQVLAEHVEGGARCTPVFTDVGDAHVHSVVCEAKTGRVYCAITPGQLGLMCGNLMQERPKAPVPAPPATAPEPPPALAPPKALKK